MRSLRPVTRDDLARLERALGYARERMTRATKRPVSVWGILYMGVLAVTRKYVQQFPEEVWRI